MSSYAELKAQAEALMRQAEEVRNTERAANLAKIRQMMTEYGISLADLGGGTGRRGGGAAAKVKAPAKFRGPNGELWSGGPGRKPEWVRTILAGGGDMEQYRLA